MARRNKTQESIEAKDYRHTGEKRKNVPLAKIAAEGDIPKVKKARYYYSPHLSPGLRFDPEGISDRVMAVCEKAGQYLSKVEKELLNKAMTNQQPWLEWAGKKEQYDRGWFEVDPVALHIHERVSAQAIVRAAMREDLQRDLFADPQLPYQKEVQFYQHDVDWANRLILGDSLQVMSSLTRRENLSGKVQMIYIDPPYGISFSSNFQPEILQRGVKDREADLTREPEMVRAFRDTWNLGVHSYCSYLRDRFILARELLANGGSIFVQIGQENCHIVRVILDEVFGADNFVSEVVFQTTPYATSNFLAPVYDKLLWYGKGTDKLKYNQLYLPKESLRGIDAYRWIDMPSGETVAYSEQAYRQHSGTENSVRRFQSTSLISQGETATPQAFVFQNKEWKPPAHSHWKTTVGGLARVEQANRMLSTPNSLRFKSFISDFPISIIHNIWDDMITGSFTEPKRFIVQTNPRVIERCILMTTEPGDLVLDPTCGSGTTAFAAEAWGRRWITIDSSRVAAAIARQRLLTAKYDYFKLHDEAIGITGGFDYKTVPHVTLKSIAQNENLDPIFEKHNPNLVQALEACNRALDGVTDDLRSRLKSKLMQKQAAEGKRSVTEADQRRWELPKAGVKWKEWEVPFDADPDWPKALEDAVRTYRKAWQAKMNEVNACIAANADQEELVDQPEVVQGIVRVSGPFTVEGVRPEELSMGDEGLFDGTPNQWEDDGKQDIADEVQNIRAYLSRMIELIRQDGITFPNNKHQEFGRVEPLYEESTGSLIHAEAIWRETDENEPNNIGITFGPQYGPVTAEQVGDIIRSGRRYDELIIAGFSFDAAALDTMQENQHPKQKIHIAHIRPDVSPGMDGLLKDTPNSQLFTVFGQPEILVKRTKKGEYTVELLGVDIYDPLKGEARSSKADKVAAWFLDSDYDGRCFCITQAFFPDQDAWDKIAKSLGSQADLEVFKTLNGTVSIPFKVGKYKRVAVKVIDPRGNEVMTIARLNEEGM